MGSRQSETLEPPLRIIVPLPSVEERRARIDDAMRAPCFRLALAGDARTPLLDPTDHPFPDARLRNLQWERLYNALPTRGKAIRLTRRDLLTRLSPPDLDLWAVDLHWQPAWEETIRKHLAAEGITTYLVPDEAEARRAGLNPTDTRGGTVEVDAFQATLHQHEKARELARDLIETVFWWLLCEPTLRIEAAHGPEPRRGRKPLTVALQWELLHRRDHCEPRWTLAQLVAFCSDMEQSVNPPDAMQQRLTRARKKLGGQKEKCSLCQRGDYPTPTT